jgi:hypothetical protein
MESTFPHSGTKEKPAGEGWPQGRGRLGAGRRNHKPVGLCADELVSVDFQQLSSAIFSDGLAPWAC